MQGSLRCWHSHSCPNNCFLEEQVDLATGALPPVGRTEGEQVKQSSAGKAVPSQKSLWQLRAEQFPAQNPAVLLSTPHFMLGQMVLLPLAAQAAGKLPLWKATRS